MIVVDVNILLYHAIQGPFTSMISQLVVKDDEWYTSFFWQFEFLNALRAMVKARQLRFDEAIAALDSTSRKIANGLRSAMQAQVLRSAIQYDISAYDAQYIAVAEQMGIPCVTADAPLVRKVPTVAVLLSDFVK
jgi:predicted nucleic acid-binding protein